MIIHLEVKLELDEEDVTKVESKGTYENIKEYIHNKYMFEVSTIHIAQTKRSEGLSLKKITINPRKKTSKCWSVRKKR